MKRIFIAILAALISFLSNAEQPVTTNQSWDGGNFYYPKGDAEVTSVILNIAEHQPLAFHCHPVPVFGYILEGKLEVETQSGKIAQFTAGDSVVEVMHSIHRGRSIDGPAKIIVFYAGAKGVPNTVLADDVDSRHYCDKPPPHFTKQFH